jgi:hypothetical protein
MWRVFLVSTSLMFNVLVTQPPSLKAQGNQEAPVSKPSNRKPKGSVRGTIDEAIRALEAFDCETFAVSFLSPLKRAAIADLNAYRQQRRCSPADKGNLEAVLLTLRLARWAEPEYRGVTAVISLEGIGAPIERISLMRYIDGKWYFNEL